MTALPPNGQPKDPASAVAGLAREVEALRRRQDQLDGTSRRLRDLAKVVKSLADQLKKAGATATGAAPAGCRTWLAAPVGSDSIRTVLDELVEWVQAVFLHYADGRAVLPECWLWHPDMVEELLWLMTVWQNAYASESVFPAADWHDRYRPGVVRRIKEHPDRSCSLERHIDPEQKPLPLMDEPARARIADWWGGSDPRGPAPIPTDDQLDHSRGEHDR